MSADAFVVFYGVRFEILSEDDLLEPLELETDDRMVRATRHGLDHWFGVATDGAPHHLYVGRNIGCFGVEGSGYRSLPMAGILQVAAETQAKLHEAGFDGEPALHMQLEAGY